MADPSKVPVPVEVFCRKCGYSWVGFWVDTGPQGKPCPECRSGVVITRQGLSAEERWLEWNRGEMPLSHTHWKALRLPIGTGAPRLAWLVAWPVLKDVLELVDRDTARVVRKAYREHRQKVTRPVRYRDLTTAQRRTLSDLRHRLGDLPAICSGRHGAPGEGAGPFNTEPISEEWTRQLEAWAEGRKRPRRRKKPVKP